MTENPLAQYFRTPAIHLDLPSKGAFYPDGAIDVPPGGEVPVMSMTAIDEITYKTPDALFNGSAVATVIESCIPSIKDAWAMPVTDLTAVLCAIRIASFGHNMEIETKCPKCGETAEYTLDLRNVLDSIKSPDYTKTLPIGDLSIMFKPMTYKDVNENNKLQFEEERLNNLLANTEMDTGDQIKLLSESFKKVSDYTLATLTKNIRAIITPDCTVSEETHILEFLKKCDNVVYKKIKNAVVNQKKDEVLKPMKIKCEAVIKHEGKDDTICGHVYDQFFTLDMTSFFDQN